MFLERPLDGCFLEMTYNPHAFIGLPPNRDQTDEFFGMRLIK